MQERFFYITNDEISYGIHVYINRCKMIFKKGEAVVTLFETKTKTQRNSTKKRVSEI